MYKKYVTAIILFNCYCSSISIDLQGDFKPAKDFSVNPELCKKILLFKGYYFVIENAKRLQNRGDTSSSSAFRNLCKMADKFSYALFGDPDAWLCLTHIVKMIKDNMDLYETALKKCNFINRWKDINCGSPAKFERCIHTKMPLILKDNTINAVIDQNACLKCREASNLEMCVKAGNLTQCPVWTGQVLTEKNLGGIYCLWCDGPKNLIGSQHVGRDSHTATVVGISVSAVLGVVLSVSVGVLAYRYARRNTAQEPKGETEQTAMSDRREPSGRRAPSIRYNPSIQYEPSVPSIQNEPSVRE